MVTIPQREFTLEEVAKNNTEDSLWIIIDSVVYDLSSFGEAHPGGLYPLKEVAGTDATTLFFNLHRYEVLEKYAKLAIGRITSEKSQIVQRKAGEISLVPYGEPTWLTPQFSSPYYKESHCKFQKAMRLFVDEHLYEEAQRCEREGSYISQEMIDKMVKLNLLRMRMGPGKHLAGLTLMDSVKGEEYDYFHDLILVQEYTRATARAFQDGNLGGFAISLPVVLQWATNEQVKKRVSEEVLSGRKKISLAISEAYAGSDVAGIRTVATKSADGKHYIVNGTKKWITNGTFSDYFVTAVKTDKGLSVLLIERGEGVETKAIKTSYSPTSGTAYITFDDVEVPVENLLGPENRGINVILSNFNHERWGMTASTIQLSRVVVEECMKWANQRLVFGKKLIDQPVIRQKLAKMIAHVEANQAWIENITYQMCNMDHKQQAAHLGGPVGLLKMFATRSAHEIADEAVQIFGGRALTQTGMGRTVEMFHRTYKFDAILGGAEEILGDLGVRQAFRNMPKSML